MASSSMVLSHTFVPKDVCAGDSLAWGTLPADTVANGGRFSKMESSIRSSAVSSMTDGPQSCSCGFGLWRYKKDEADSKKLVVDEEAAAVVRRIFAMCAAGRGPSQIARKLSEEQILCPTTYAYQKFGGGHVSLDLEKPCHWTDSTIANMLENELYLGNTVNLRFSSKSYKDKR